MTMGEKRRRSRRLRALAYAGVAVAWALTVWVSTVLSPPEWVRTPVLFLHLASLVVGLGAVLMVEWYAFLWATDWRSPRDLRQVDVTLRVPIWAGLIGLLASGALLQPDLGAPLTIVKLGAVLVVALNGVAITQWTGYLARFPRRMRFGSLSWKARFRFVSSAIVSQIAWWTAVVIGMLNSTT
jgi:hypothetical protein